MIDLDELERLRQRGAEIQYAAALFDAAPELIAMARRYQLLRRGQRWSVINGIGDELRAEALDAAIDAAMQEQKP